MRRQDKAITDMKEIEAVLQASEIIHIGLCDHGIPYVVPMSFGLHCGRIYLHSAPEGRKLEIISRHNIVSFNCITDLQLLTGSPGKPCSWTMGYRSVSGTGRIRAVDTAEEQQEGLTAVMEHYGYHGVMTFPDLSRVNILCIHIDELTGKKSGQ